ncbi:MAG: dihydrolipoyl dehydrogenase [Candidatus Marsarchaeota archaeon]|nr:dihydrolipoyl dehydrogenase [Candidatus Marsarchaeota archaeon]MCL5095001.1 dihydrolipoyl dehydrogenase [Candidatus Marsarchaeota archaeon]
MVMGSIPENVDVAVVGGGLGGYISAIRASQLGLNVVLVEKHKLGGHCLNYACIPSKTLIHISDILYNAKNSQNFGINASDISIDAKKMYEYRINVSKKLEQGVEFLCKSNDIEVIKSEATFLSSNSLQVSDGIKINFKKAIIATGSEPVELKGFEFNNINILDYKKALSLDKIPESIAIIGAGFVSIEIGTLYAKLGSKVSIISRSDILSNFDPDAVAIIKKRMQILNINIYTNSTPVSYKDNVLELNNGSKIIAELIVVSIGMYPYTQNLGLENTKVQTDKKGFVITDNKLYTTDENILAVGDVIGQPMLAHKAIRQGIVAGESVKSPAFFDNIVIPYVVFSDPEIAVAGDIKTSSLKIAKFPLTALGRAIAFNRTDGFVKIAYNEDNIVKGIEIVSEDANALISEAALAIEMGATLEDIADTIHPHPTFAESIQEAAEIGLGRPVHFFIKK